MHDTGLKIRSHEIAGRSGNPSHRYCSAGTSCQVSEFFAHLHTPFGQPLVCYRKKLSYFGCKTKWYVLNVLLPAKYYPLRLPDHRWTALEHGQTMRHGQWFSQCTQPRVAKQCRKSLHFLAPI